MRVATKLYIASCLKHRNTVEIVSECLLNNVDGIEIVSTWHKNAMSTVAVERTLTQTEQEGIAMMCASEVRKADALIWIYGDNDGRTGAAIECGIAIELGRHRPHSSMNIYACPAPLATRSELPLMLYSAEAWTHFDSIDVMLEELSRE